MKTVYVLFYRLNAARGRRPGAWTPAQMLRFFDRAAAKRYTRSRNDVGDAHEYALFAVPFAALKRVKVQP